MVAGAAAEIENGADPAVSIIGEDPLYQVALSLVVLLAVQRVIRRGVPAAEDLAQLRTSRTAAQTRSSCSSVRARPDGR